MATFDRSNPYQTQLFAQKVLMPYWEDYRNTTNLFRFAGGRDAIIVNNYLSKGAGDTIQFPFRQIDDPLIVTGNQQLEGFEQELLTVSDEIRVDLERFAVAVTNEDLILLQTKAYMSSDLKEALLVKADRMNTKRVIASFAAAFQGPSIRVSAKLEYSDLTSRMINANLDVAGNGMSRSRILFGNGYYTTQASVGAALAGIGANVANHKLTVEHIRNCQTLANTGRSPVITGGGGAAFTSKETAINPYVVRRDKGYPDNIYVWMMPPEAWLELVKDPEFQNQRNRGVIESKDQPSALHGTMYKGMMDSTMLFVVPELSNLTITTGGHTYAYSVLCGASTIGFAMGKMPYFTDRSNTDYELYKGIAHNEISGMKVLKYPSVSIGTKGNNTNLVEYGLLHSFTTLA